MGNVKGKTVSTNQEEPEGSGEYGTPIYLNLNGNGWDVNSVYLTQALYESRTYNRPLYVTSNVGGPQGPPSCPPGFPNCKP